MPGLAKSFVSGAVSSITKKKKKEKEKTTQILEQKTVGMKVSDLSLDSSDTKKIK